MQKWPAIFEMPSRLMEVETTNFEKVVHTQMDRAIFEAYNQDICRINGASCQWLKQSIQ